MFFGLRSDGVPRFLRVYFTGITNPDTPSSTLKQLRGYTHQVKSLLAVYGLVVNFVHLY